MKWHALVCPLALLLFAAPALAVDAVRFAGFSGLVLGSPAAPSADVPERSFVALYALAEHGGMTKVSAICELEGPREKLAPRGAGQRVKVLVTLVRADGSRERVAQLKMRLAGRFAEAAKMRELTVAPGDYLLYDFRLKGRMELGPDQRLILTGFAGAPDLK